MKVTVYHCNYCGIDHDDGTHSVEHIIPEALLNGEILLPRACRYWNNFFARSFESAVTNSYFMKEVIRAFEPGVVPRRRAIYLEPVKTARGTTEHLWILDGKEVVRDVPERTTTNRLPLDAFDVSGQPHQIEVMLPFDYTIGVRGDDVAIKNVQAKIEKERKKVMEYVGLLAGDPSRDPVLNALLQENGWTLRPPRSVEVEQCVVAAMPSELVDDIQPKVYVLDAELWNKFYMKIAWCFACLVLGRSELIARGGQQVVEYLKSGAVPAAVVESCRGLDAQLASEMFREASLDGGIIWFWRGDISATDKLLRRAPAEFVTAMRSAFELRKRSSIIATTWVKSTPGNLDRADGPPPADRRFHSLRLQRISRDGRSALICRIVLFGGVFAADVQLTSSTPNEASSLDGFAEVERQVQF